MAWFHFCTANHNRQGRATLGDMAAWFEAGLLDLGHKVTFSDAYVEPRAINLFWECFSARAAREIAGLDVPFGIVATEIPDGAGFNWRREPSWVARFKAFETVARRAAFIWTMIESTVPFYARYCPAAYVELGFSDRLVPRGSERVPSNDFSFFGLRTPYREAIVSELRQAGVNVAWPDRFLDDGEVQDLICSSKIGLSFKQSEQWPIPSPTRLGRLMLARRVVASEHVPVATQQGAIAGLCPPDRDFSSYALGLLDGWQERAEHVFERYRTAMPMHRLLEKVLDTTVTARANTTGPAATAPNVTSPAATIALQQEPDAPILVGVINRYNIVAYADRFIAIPQTKGAIDFSEHDPNAFEFQSRDRSELERRVATMEPIVSG